MNQLTNSQPRAQMRRMLEAMTSIITGYDNQMEMMLLALIADGHVSAEGDPGTGKTMSMKVLAHVLKAEYKRVQMLPDTMPSDIVGSEVKMVASDAFDFKPGPLNEKTNLLHADEINRTPPRTQAALLEGMEERQVSVAGYTSQTFRLSDVFMVLATQNPLESDGVYPLPEAQLDRFAIQLVFPKLSREQELEVVKRTAFDRHMLPPDLQDIVTLDDIRAMRAEMKDAVACSDDAFTYAHDLCYATHPEHCPPSLKDVFKTGVSVRASQWAVRLAKTRAYLHGRSHVMPEDIKFVAPSVLRHRLYIEEAAELKKMTKEKALEAILAFVSPSRAA